MLLQCVRLDAQLKYIFHPSNTFTVYANESVQILQKVIVRSPLPATELFRELVDVRSGAGGVQSSPPERCNQNPGILYAEHVLTFHPCSTSDVPPRG